MDLETLTRFLAWNLTFNLAVLIFWLLLLVFSRDCLHRFHNKFFPMSKEQFVSAHYYLYGAYKLAIILFNLVPYLTLRHLI